MDSRVDITRAVRKAIKEAGYDIYRIYYDKRKNDIKHKLILRGRDYDPNEVLEIVRTYAPDAIIHRTGRFGSMYSYQSFILGNKVKEMK
jgi:hypothetical protein